MIELQKSSTNGYYCPADPGEPGWKPGSQRMSVNDVEARILSEFSCGKTVLEIGTGLGVSTKKLAETAKTVYTVDIDPWVAEAVAPSLPANVRFFKSIDEYGIAPGFDMAFVDGCHDYESCLKDTEAVKKLVKPGGLLLFHDFRMPSIARALVVNKLDAVFIGTVAGLGLAWNNGV